MIMHQLAILAVDDLEIGRESIRNSLFRAGYPDVRIASSAQEALAMLEKRAADVVLADWVMPEIDGLELAQRIRRMDEARMHYTSVVLLTVKDGVEPLVEAFERGVDDYITRPVSDRELAARIYAAGRVAMQQNTLMETVARLGCENDKLKELATTDPLTGVGNRRYMEAHLASLIKETHARGGVTTCAIVDLDHFKHINDRFGHPVGDEVLRGFARRLCWSVRPADVVTRIGGEEFAILMHHPDPSKYSPVIFERLRRTVAQHPISTSVGDIPVTASIGVASYSGDSDMDGEALVTAADSMLYAAKRQGRNRVAC